MNTNSPLTKGTLIVALVPSLLFGAFFGLLMFRLSGMSFLFNAGCTLGIVFICMCIILIPMLSSINREIQAVNKMRNVTDLITILKNKGGPIRSAAATRLGDLGDSQAVEPLIAALQDTEGMVRNSVAGALGKLGDPRAVEPLVAVLRDKDGSVRTAATDALGRLRDSRAVEPLIMALQDQNRSIQASAADALGKLGDHRAIEPLTAALQDKDDTVRSAAANALKQLVDLQPVKPLTEALSEGTGSTLPVSTVAAAPEFRDAQNIEPFIAALQDAQSSVRASAATTLGKLGDRRAVELLISALQDKEAAVRASAISALENLSDSRAVEPLVSTLWDSHASVRNLAATALKKLGDPKTVELLITNTRDKYSSGQIPVKSTIVKTQAYRSPEIPECCVGCGGPPPLVAEAFGKEVSVTIPTGGREATATRSGFRSYLTQKYPLHFYLCESCAPKERAMKPLKERAMIIGWIVAPLVIILYGMLFYAIRLIFGDPGKSLAIFFLFAFLVGSIFLWFIAKSVTRHFLVIKNRPNYVGPQFENDLVSFSKNSKDQGSSDELTYTFACDSYGEKFREANSQISR